MVSESSAQIELSEALAQLGYIIVLDGVTLIITEEALLVLHCGKKIQAAVV